MRASCSLSLLALALAAASHAAPVDPAYPAFAGAFYQPAACYGSAVSGDTLFLGGSLRWVGPLTGGGVAVQASDLAPLAGFPHVNGIVLAATPDGAGGWYIGGQFTHVGGTAHVNLAHILADLSVDAWAPSTNGGVITILATAQEVYFGGSFTLANGVASSGFAGVSRATGVLVLNPSMGGLVAALTTDGTKLYVGGEFTSAAGLSRTRLAAFLLSNHTLSAWTAAASDGVYALRFANGLVYAGGNFATVLGIARPGAAALDPVTAALAPWNPQATGGGYRVRAILPVGDRVYLGGGFDHVGGVIRRSLAAVDTATGAVLAWDPQVTVQSLGWFPADVTSLELAGADILAGGDFDHAGGVARSELVRLDAATAAPILPAPEAPAEARALAASGANVFVGGRFSTFGPSRRGDLVAVRISTGEALSWTPSATRDAVESLFGNFFYHASNVTALAVDATRVYVAISFFDAAFGKTRQSVNAYSRATGAALWGFEPYGTVYALTVLDARLIVGGDFIPPSPSGGLFACDAASGAGLTWGGSVSGGPVLALQPTPAGLAVGGAFTSAGGQPRTDLALLDPASGLATGWDPGADGGVWSFALAGPTLYCGGDFATVGGQARARLAALPLDSTTPTAWNPGANASVRALAFAQGIVYAGGMFTTLAGQPRTCVAAVNPADGTALPWDAAIQPGHAVFGVAAGAGRVFAAGTQTASGTEPTSGFTPVMGPDAVLDVPVAGELGAGLGLHVEPQPVRAAARIRFQLASPGEVEIGIYDLAGRRVQQLAPRHWSAAGEQTVTLARRGMRAGLYLVRVSTPEANAACKVIVVSP
jgi:hypothetical protein